MQLPTDMATWTYETVLDVVRNHEFEPGQFDYKAVLHPREEPKSKKDFNDSIRKAACSMANTDGGFILFGILDRAHPVSTPEERIQGIPYSSDLLREFGDKLLGVQPEIHFTATPAPIRLPETPDLGIFVVYVARSPRRPHMDESAHVFYRRGDGGRAVEMRYHEVLEQMLFTEERMQKVNLFRLYVRQYRTTIGELVGLDDAEISTAHYRFDTSAFMPLLADICGLLPPPMLTPLINLRSRADRYNRLLDNGFEVRLRGGESFREQSYIIRNALRQFDTECALADQELDAIFGQLGGRMSMPT